jgi:hypothetical protein
MQYAFVFVGHLPNGLTYVLHKALNFHQIYSFTSFIFVCFFFVVVTFKMIVMIYLVPAIRQLYVSRFNFNNPVLINKHNTKYGISFKQYIRRETTLACHNLYIIVVFSLYKSGYFYKYSYKLV